MSEKFSRGTINPKQTKQTEEFKLLKGEMKYATKVEVNVGNNSIWWISGRQWLLKVNYSPLINMSSTVYVEIISRILFWHYKQGYI